MRRKLRRNQISALSGTLKYDLFHKMYKFFVIFDEVSTIRKPKMMMFSITGSQIFLAGLLFLPKANEKLLTGLSFTPPHSCHETQCTYLQYTHIKS